MVWAAVIFVLSAISGDEYPKVQYEHADKAVHIIMYVPIGILCARWFQGERAHLRAGAAVAAGLLYAATDEWHQRYVPFRNVSVADWIADAIGVVLGVLVWVAVRKKSCRDIEAP